MELQFFTISKHKLTNHCPECYSDDGLELTIKQGFNETPFYKAITNDKKANLHCHTCDTEIYPVRWTEDIERVVAYHQRGSHMKKRSVKLKKLTWILLIVALVLIAVLAVNYFNDTDVIDLD